MQTHTLADFMTKNVVLASFLLKYTCCTGSDISKSSYQTPVPVKCVCRKKKRKKKKRAVPLWLPRRTRSMCYWNLSRANALAHIRANAISSISADQVCFVLIQTKEGLYSRQRGLDVTAHHLSTC